MALNLSDLILKLSQKIEIVQSASESLTLLKAIQSLKTTGITVVSAYNQLPTDYSNFVNGSVFLVESEATLYILDKVMEVYRPIDSDVVSKVYSWGIGSFGYNGDGTTIDRSSPVSIATTFSDWCSVSSGYGSGGAIRTNGTIWLWGSGYAGILGDNTTVNKSSPVSVVGGFTDWCQVSIGFTHSAAIRTNGTVWSWGSGRYGVLGDNTIVDKSSPVSVVGGFTDWCQVSAGRYTTFALRQNGTLWAWGNNYSGKLGDNTTVSKSSPVSVVGGFTDWCQVSAGCYHTAAVRQNGTLWAWGCNSAGQLGDNTTINKSSPISVVGGFNDWCVVSTGYAHTVAIRQNGTLWSWGTNTSGILGDGFGLLRSSPVSVVGGFTDWCQVNTGFRHSSALRQNGTLWSWGYNGKGRLGDGTTTNRSSPVSVVGGFTDWCQIAAGGDNTVALRMRTL